MPITSIYYLCFLTVVSVLYYILDNKHRSYLLILASFIFYYLNQKWYLLFLVGSISVNYALCYLWLAYRRKVFVISAVFYNVSVLAFFKYIPVILNESGSTQTTLWSKLLLPVGISFFSFQAIGYVLDLYWSGREKQSSLLQFSLYMSFFPHLLSGPIARSKEFMPEIDRTKHFEYENYVAGGRLILWGLFKKLVIANNLSPFTDAVFNNHAMHNGSTLLVAAVAYSLQVYMDFSGYSDIAIGSAKTLGFNLKENFRRPYFSRSVTDFWRKWHISLSSWVRDYVNIPLQYKLRSWGTPGILIAAYITFLIIGIWHGASLNYVAFGLLQGTAISCEVLTVNWRRKLWTYIPENLGNTISNLLVFSFFAFSAILLRVSLPDALQIITRLSLDVREVFWGSKQLLIYSAIGILAVWMTEYKMKDMVFQNYISGLKLQWRWSFYVLGTVLIVMIGGLSSESFIYFQF